MTPRTILQQRLPQVRLLGVCGSYYADPFLLKHLEGLVRESPVRLLKASHMSAGNVLHKGGYFKYLSRDKSSHLTSTERMPA